ncbi:MAG: ABC-F family ATP-binding cassette domain-containing protein [Bacteroidaceae bacterium]|nr:ABC-F family ATP-binding cassette domain-containing protein [Bacteroidaceae bacterium]
MAATQNPVLQVERLTKSFGVLVLFHDICFGLSEGQHVGLIAKNGTGKSTLLNILAGVEPYDDGKITFRRDLRVGYLPQTPHYPSHLTVLEACLQHGSCQLDLHKDYELAAKQLLTKLKVSELYQPVSELSGGQLKRIALVNALINDPELLILDEPTNHLDLDMVEWLEDYLRRSNMTLLMVTHDRYFLDRVCNQIMELDDESLYQYDGNYAYYLEKRQERMDAKAVEIERANNLYRTELDWMRRMPQARGHKARYREEAFYELEKVAKQRIYDNKVQLNVKSAYIGNKIFEADHLCKSFGDVKILDDFSYVFSRYEKMGIVGNNGTGKSTFLKILLGELPIDGGNLEIGSTVRFGYYSQEGIQFNDQMKVIDAVRDIAEVVELGNGKRLGVSQFLQYFLFTPETQHNYIYKLSGGERRRLYLCTVLMRNPNFLILDEPTNDLDIMTLQVLEEYLMGFGGCVIVVSHDRYFMDKVVDHILVFNGQGDIRDFPGNYTQYRAWKEEKERYDREQAKATQPVIAKQERQRQNTKRRMTFKERREFEQLEKDIEALEAEKKQLEADLCSGILSVEELTEKSKRLPVIETELDEKSFRWLELSEIAD